MRIAFYSPIKSPHHPVPSGDRLMARLLMKALELAGHEVVLASEFRSFMAVPDPDLQTRIRHQAALEIARVKSSFEQGRKPDLWFTYHPYYKAPDLLGPQLCSAFGIPYVTAEASYSARRNAQGWKAAQNDVLDAIRMAAVNIGMTARDRKGLAEAAPDASIAALHPFIDPSAFMMTPDPVPGHLICVAMMRNGDKLESYRHLARSLDIVRHLPWSLTIVGDGLARYDVRDAFSRIEASRVHWTGEMGATELADLLARSSLFVWPGCGEAYGLAYLEAQAAGLPVVAFRTAGVPEVVIDDETGLLVPEGDCEAYASAVARLIEDDDLRSRLAENALNFARVQRHIEPAAARLQTILTEALLT